MGSSPNLILGQVPTPGQWNSFFIAKQDELNYVPLSNAGGTLTGPLITTASTATAAGLNVPQGVTPTTPNNGDMWATAAGLFARIAGITITLGQLSSLTLGGPLTTTGTGPTTLAFPVAGPATYTFPTVSGTLVTGSAAAAINGVVNSIAGGTGAFSVANAGLQVTGANLLGVKYSTGLTVSGTGALIVNGGQIAGTPTNDSANAGNIGEYIEATIGSASAIGVSTGTPINITSISLTAGDWDVSGVGYFQPAATTTTSFVQVSTSLVSAVTDLTGGRYGVTSYQSLAAIASTMSAVVAPTRFSFSTTTTVFLTANTVFATSTMTVWGHISARRAR